MNIMLIYLPLILNAINDNFGATYTNIKGLLHGYEWGLRFGGLELRFG